MTEKKEMVNHPSHYGTGADDPYETIKVIEAWGVDFHIGNVIKYVSRAGKKGEEVEDLKKALWYLKRKIFIVEKEQQKVAKTTDKQETHE